MKRGEGLKRRKRLERRTELSPNVEKVREFLQRSRAAPRPMVEKVCRTCGRRFKIRAAAADRGEGKYCSRACWPKTPYVDRICENCGASFSVEERLTRDPLRGRFCSRACANAPDSSWGGKRTTTDVGSPSQRARFRSAQTECVHPACEHADTRCHEHHVVYEQHVRREGGDVYDPRNALTLCISCHTSHHRRGSRTVPLRVLRDANYEFAFELLGAAAFDYLRRRYTGGDPRLQQWLDRVTAAVNSSK